MVVSKASLKRRWFALLTAVSVSLVLITGASYAFEGAGALSALLFLIGLGGENNVGAWWSGMLLLLAAVFAFDGYWCAHKSADERRAWLALAAVFVLLSFDEVASVHEYVSGKGIRYLVPFGLVGLGLIIYSLSRLRRAGVPTRELLTIVVAFGLLGTVPLQEFVQHNVEWTNPIAYGIRAVLEEGSEIAAMLLLIAVTRANSAVLLRSGGEILAAVARFRVAILIGGLLLAPVLAELTFVLPYPPGPANWLAQTLYLACALLVVRSVVMNGGELTWRSAALFLFYVAGAASSAINLAWNPAVLGIPLSLRGVCAALLLVTALPLLRANGRIASGLGFAPAGAAVLVASLWSESQLLWSFVPALVPLWLYAIESKTAAIAENPLRAVQPPKEPPAAEPPLPV